MRITRDGRYGDSIEQVFLNTVLGAKKLEDDGHAFYYSDYNFRASRTYFDQLLSVQRADGDHWEAGGVRFAPFTAIQDAPYSTYIRLA